MWVHLLRGPSLDFHVHNGKTEASILVILYLHLLARPLGAMQRSDPLCVFCVRACFSFICHKTYLLHLNVPKVSVRVSVRVCSHSSQIDWAVNCESPGCFWSGLLFLFCGFTMGLCCFGVGFVCMWVGCVWVSDCTYAFAWVVKGWNESVSRFILAKLLSNKELKIDFFSSTFASGYSSLKEKQNDCLRWCSESCI